MRRIPQRKAKISSSRMPQKGMGGGITIKLTPLKTAGRHPPSKASLSSSAAIALAISFGLCAGFLDLGIIGLSKYFWHAEGYFRTARDSPWTIPLGHALLLFIPGVVIAAMNRRPRPVSLPAAAWLFATLALWAALARTPLYIWCTLLLAIGLGRLAGSTVAAVGLHPRWYAARPRLPARGCWGLGGALIGMASGPQSRRSGPIAEPTGGRS